MQGISQMERWRVWIQTWCGRNGHQKSERQDFVEDAVFAVLGGMNRTSVNTDEGKRIPGQ